MNSDKCLEKYSELPFLRAAVQLIPYIGSSIDTILYDKGNKWRMERTEFFIENFSEKIEQIIKDNANIKDQINNKINTEEFHDLFILCQKEVMLTRHKEKIELFSNILLNYSNNVINENEDVDLILNIVSNISMIFPQKSGHEIKPLL